jgi:hypothetical protein
MEAYLGKPIERLSSERDFDHYLSVFNGYLPSSRMRWCTRLLKLRPFEQYVGDDVVVNYVGHPRRREPRGLHLDEAQHPIGVPLPRGRDHEGRRGAHPGGGRRRGAEVLPLAHALGVLLLLLPAQGGVGRAQAREHPALFEEAKAYEKVDPETGERYTWRKGETLDELVAKELAKGDAEGRPERAAKRRNLPLVSVFDEGEDDEDDEDRACLICEL